MIIIINQKFRIFVRTYTYISLYKPYLYTQCIFECVCVDESAQDQVEKTFTWVVWTVLYLLYKLQLKLGKGTGVSKKISSLDFTTRVLW